MVALFGSDCSDKQAHLIVQATTPNGRIWVLADTDTAGEKCAISVLSQVSPHRWVRWVKPRGKQPTDCTPGDLEKILPGLDTQRKEVAHVSDSLWAEN